MSTDSEVIERSGDEPGAFAVLFDRHAPAIYRYAAQRMGDHRAEDIMSETFLVAFGAPAGGTPYGKLDPCDDGASGC